MNSEEAPERLAIITELVDKALANQDMLVSTQTLLFKVKAIAMDIEIPTSLPIILERKKYIICSSSASSERLSKTKYKSCYAYSIAHPSGEPNPVIQLSKSDSRDSAECIAIYAALVALFNQVNHPAFPVEVHTSNREIVDSVTKGMDVLLDESFKVKIESIREYISVLPVEVKFVWKPRYSSEEIDKLESLCIDAWCDYVLDQEEEEK